MTSLYTPETVPGNLNDPKELQAFLDRELRNIAKAMDRSTTVTLEVLFVAPARPEEGMAVYADGTSWNPGSGEGYYGYVNGVWIKLSLLTTDDLTIDDLIVDTLIVNGLLTLNGGQIKFPAVQNASADANTLDDYEEGTWTPTFTVGGSGAGVTYTTQVGRYTKVGRLVAIEGELTLSNNGTNVGNCLIASLPFTIGVDHAAVVICGNSSGFSGLTAGITGEFIGGTVTITLRAPTTTGGAALQETQVSNTARFLIGGSYSV